jgi:hypothetical protein
MMKSFKIPSALFVIIALLLFSCEGEFEATSGFSDINLLFPENNEQCLGTNLPNGKIRVNFAWEDVTGTTSYILEYEDTVTGNNFSETTSASSLDIELEPGTLYSWKVTISDDFGGMRSSDTFSFYTEGLADENHVPFPAEIDVVNNGNGTLNISWRGADLDDDISFYNVFFSDSSPPTQLLSETTTESTTVNIQIGRTYYLNVVTVDRNGNFSDSKRSVQF